MSLWLKICVLCFLPFPVYAEPEDKTPATKPLLIKDPVLATIDGSGRLIVIEKSGRVRVLWDLDSNGVYEKATTFAKEVTAAQGLLWVQDGLYVLGEGTLWRIDEALEPEALVVGFGKEQALRGPFLHPNGRLFWINGPGEHEVFDPDMGELVSSGNKSAVWSCRIDGSDPEIFSLIDPKIPDSLSFSAIGRVKTPNLTIFRGNEDFQCVVRSKETSEISRKNELRLPDGSRLVIGEKIFRIGEYDVNAYGNTINWDGPAEDLMPLLDSRSAHLRERTISTLAGKGDPALPELRQLLEDKTTSARARRNAVWTLARLRFSHSADLILNALKDPEPSVAAAACDAVAATRDWRTVAFNMPDEAAIEIERNHKIVQQLAVLARGGEMPMLQAVEALGRMGDPAAVPALISVAGRKDVSRELEHAVTLALVEIGEPDVLRDALRDGIPRQKKIALVVLNHIEPDLGVLSVLPHLDSEDESLRKTAIKLAGNRKTWDAALANRFLDWLESENGFTEIQQDVVEELVPKFKDTPPMKSFLEKMNGKPEPEPQP